MLVILGGLPGTGKTTIARALARRIGAVHLRIDTIEQALRSTSLLKADVGPRGYVVAYGIAADNLQAGHIVIADSVNPIALTRRAWRSVAETIGVPCLEVEILCSDLEIHRRRVETRTSDIKGLTLPNWDDVTVHEYEPWSTRALALDTAVWAGACLPAAGDSTPTIGLSVASQPLDTVASAAANTKGSSVMSMKILIAASVAATLGGGAIVARHRETDPSGADAAQPHPASTASSPELPQGSEYAIRPPPRRFPPPRRWTEGIEAVRSAHALAQPTESSDGDASQACTDPAACVGPCRDEGCVTRLAGQVLELVDGCKDFLVEPMDGLSLTAEVVGAPDVGTFVESVVLDSKGEASEALRECLTQSMYSLELEAEADNFQQRVRVGLDGGYLDRLKAGQQIVLEAGERGADAYLANHPELSEALAQLQDAKSKEDDAWQAPSPEVIEAVARLRNIQRDAGAHGPSLEMYVVNVDEAKPH